MHRLGLPVGLSLAVFLVGTGCAPRSARPIRVSLPALQALDPVCADAGVTACEEACAQGDGVACLTAAHAYEEGKGVRVDKDKMVEMEAAGCALDVALACLHHSQSELPLAVTLASANKACALGSSKGCANAVERATLRVMREGAELALVPETLAAACESDATFCGRLADFVQLGMGVPKDEDKARALHTRGCEAGNTLSCRQLEDETHVWARVPYGLLFDRVHAPITPMRFEHGVVPAEGTEIVFRTGLCFDGSPTPTLVPVEPSIAPDFDAGIIQDSQKWHYSLAATYPRGESFCLYQEFRAQ